VITRQTPIASLLISGELHGFTRSVQPPKELIGRRIHLHAGQGLCAIKPLQSNPAAQRLICNEAGEADLGSWRKGLDRLSERDGGKILGSAVLSAAFIIGQVIGAEGGPQIVASYKPDSHGVYYLGNWRKFDGRRQVTFGDYSAPDKAAKKRRWLWCFHGAQMIPRVMPGSVKGFGGLWDYERGLDLRLQQIENERKAATS